MDLIFSARAWEGDLHWQATEAELLARLDALYKECVRTPYQGLENRAFRGE